MTFSKGTSENTILFFEGGHNHDGQSSALIDVSQYSIYDFVVGNVGSSSRQITQQRNFDNLKTVICNIVTTDILGPAGVRLAPNSVQSVNIAAGAVTASELAANIVLVNNIISSGNYVPNTSGWAINSNGSAEFANTSIRGALVANSVSTPGIDILANGAIVSTNFNVSPNGDIAASNVSISGEITASMVEASTFYIDAFNYWGANGEFRVGSGTNYLIFDGTDVLLTGAVVATSGSIGNWTITSTNIYNNTGISNTVLSANGFITAGTLKIGNNDISDAEDIVATNIIKAEQFELQAGSMKGVFYTGTASSAGTGNFGISFYWNGTNVYARMYNIANNQYQDVCLSNCGTGTTGTTTTTTTTATTAAPGGGGGTTTTTAPACPPLRDCGPVCCPEGQICTTLKGDSYCIVA